MNGIEIFKLIVFVITLLAFIYQTHRFIKTKDVCEGIWVVMFWVALMTIS